MELTKKIQKPKPIRSFLASLTLVLSILLVTCALPGSDPSPETITITTTTLSNGLRGATYTPITLSAAGGESASYGFRVSSGALPAGLTLSAIGEISGTPTAAGTFAFTAQVSDGAGNTGTRELSLFIDAIAIGPTALVNGQLLVAYSQSLSAARGSSPYSFAIIGGALPAGLSLNSSNGLVSGTPTMPDVSTFTILVTDSNGAYNEKQFMMRIILRVPVAITTTACPGGFKNGPYTTRLSATGGQGHYIWSIESGSLPEGLSLNSSLRPGEISGTATTAGTFSFVVRAVDLTDATNFHLKELSITISSGVSVLTTSMVRGFVSGEYSAGLTATGGSGGFSWSIIAGSLPANLSLNSAGGLITGTPSAAGISNFTVRATDTANSGNYSDRDLSIIIDEHVAISTTTLPSVGANRAYCETLGKSGGSGSYLWSIEAGALPLDVTLVASTGVISGYPSRPGNYSFTVRCADNANAANYATRALTLQVTNCEWTIMLYLNGDNNNETQAFEDLNEAEFSDLEGSGIKVIALLDGNGSCYSGPDAFSNTRLCEVQYDPFGPEASTGIVSRRLASTELGLTATGTEELNMADPATIGNLINFTKANFAANNYSIILFNHGTGWTSTPEKTIKVWNRILTDDSSGGANLSTRQLASALAGKGMAVVAFDANLSGMLEVAYEIRNSAAVMIGSEENEPAAGWDYTLFLNDFAAKGTRTAEELGKSAVGAYALAYGGQDGISLSAIRLSSINAVKAALDSFVAGLNTAGFASVYQVVNSTGAAQRYFSDYDKMGYYQSNLDLYDLAAKLSSVSGAAGLQSAITAAVIQEYHSGPSVINSHGIAIYYPAFNFALGWPVKDYIPANLALATDSGWDDYIHAFWRAADIYEPNDGPEFATAITDGVNYSGLIQFYGNDATLPQDYDVYKIEVTGNGTFTATLNLNGSPVMDGAIMIAHQSDPDLIFDGVDAIGVGVNESFTYDTTPASGGKGTGTYYILIMDQNPATYDRSTAYTLRISQGTAVIQ